MSRSKTHKTKRESHSQSRTNLATQVSSTPVRLSRWILISAGVVLILLIAWCSLYFFAGDPASGHFKRALAFGAAGDAKAAEASAWKAWTLNPKMAEAALLAAEMALRQERFAEAIEYASNVAEENPQLRFTALRMIAITNFRQLSHFTDAERAFRQALQLNEDDPECNSELAKLLGTCGRRDEAIPYVLRLVRGGYASDLLMLLAKEDAIINDVQALETAREVSPADPLPLVGLAWHAAENNLSQQALSLLHKAIETDTNLACSQVAFAKLLANEGKFEELQMWESKLGELRSEVDSFADPWIARARLAEYAKNTSGAIRCYLEAAQRSPDSKVCNAKLAQLLEPLDALAAKTFRDYATRTQELKEEQNLVLFSGNSRRMLNLIEKYEAVGRMWEAFGWSQLALDGDPSNRVLREKLQRLQSQLRAAPLQLVESKSMPSNRVDLSKYPIPRFEKSIDQNRLGPQRDSTISNFAFDDEAEKAGLNFSFFNGTSEKPQRRMYEFTGGGVGVIDYDLDGFPDVALTQGTRWPPNPNDPEFTDALFRNIEGQQWQRGALNLTEDGFGQGISVGDFDSDGFADLYIAQIGQNRLLRNNGDGTFSDLTDSAQIVANDWTTSCVIVDLNQDGLPDIYDVNYVQGSDVFDRICLAPDGQPGICMPFDFEAAPDRLWFNNGDGSFRDATTTALSDAPTGKGLGVVAMRADEKSPLSLFVANDTTPNFWITPDAVATSGKFTERGIGSGFAFNANGTAEGSMGIATDDVNRDGRIDLLVTNFLNESNTLYINRNDGQFSDETRAFGLREPSLGVLGFGAQFLDADLDGTSELFVANGHIDDFSRLNRPYKMEPQLFAMVGGRFALVAPSDKTRYMRNKILGRAVAKLDWNKDGSEDLVVGQLAGNYALLTNSSGIHGNSIALRLIGTKSNRDAIGTIVELRIGNETLVKQVTAGDGYQASNQHHLVFGIGSLKQADQLRIHWPAGGVEEMNDVPANSQLEIIER